MFEPWIGTNYGNQQNCLSGFRLLLLGESHYTHDPSAVGIPNPNFTNDVVEELAIESSYLFFKRLSYLSTGMDRNVWSAEENYEFWHSVAFYNFVPDMLAHKARPSNEQWAAGRASFPQQLQKMQPDGVIVCGLTLWWWVMDSLPGGVDAHPPAQGIAWSGTTQFIRIPHITGARGASAYSYAVSRPIVAAMLNQP